MDLTRKIQALVDGVPDGLVRALAEINEGRANQMSAQVLNNKLNPNYAQDCLNIHQIEAVVRRLDLGYAVACYFAEKSNAVVVKLPAVAESDMALLDDFMNIAKELGETSQRFQTGFADGVITHAEYQQISKEVHDTVAALLQFEQSVQRVVR